MFTSTFSRIPFTVFAPDSGGGTGGSGDEKPTETPKPQEGDKPGGSGTPDNPAEVPVAADEKDPAKRLEIVEKALKDANREAAGYRTKLRKIEEDAQAADAQKLKEQGEWQKLAEQQEARVKELEPLQEKLAAYEKRETERIAETVKDWPDNLKKLVDKASTLEEKQTVVESLKPTVDALANKPSAPGNGPGPKPASPTTEKITPSRPVRF